MLPRYFKTKNYSSFVRQLNMYNFHKVKNKEGLHEFKHENFKRGQRDGLRLISRKIAETSEASQVEVKDQKSLLLENNRLKKQIVENEESLRVVSAQTKLVIDTNKDLIYKIWKSKTENDVKIRKLLFLFFSLFTNTQPELLRRVKAVFLRSAGIDTPPDDFALTLPNVSHFIQSLIQNVFSSTEKEDACVSALMEGFLEVQNGLETNDGNRVTMDQLLQKLQLNVTGKQAEEAAKGAAMLNFPQFMRPEDDLSQMDQMSSYGNSLYDANSMVDMDLTNFKLSQTLTLSKNASRRGIDDRSLYGGSNYAFDLRTPHSEQNDKDSTQR